MMTYTREGYLDAYAKDLDTEARCSVRDFKRRLPAAIRRTVKADGWALRIGDHTSLVAYFRDENGRHEISTAI